MRRIRVQRRKWKKTNQQPRPWAVAYILPFPVLNLESPPTQIWLRRPHNDLLLFFSLVIQCGAAVNVQDHDGWTPLHAAAHWGQREACELLCENYANMDVKNYVGQTCFDVADPGTRSCALPSSNLPVEYYLLVHLRCVDSARRVEEAAGHAHEGAA